MNTIQEIDQKVTELLELIDKTVDAMPEPDLEILAMAEPLKKLITAEVESTKMRALLGEDITEATLQELNKMLKMAHTVMGNLGIEDN